VEQDLLDDLRLVNEGDYPHSPPTARAQQGIRLVDLLATLGPPLLEGARAGGWWDFDDSLRSRRLPLFLCLLPLPSTDVAVPAIVPDYVLALVGDVRGEGGQPVQGGEDLDVSREDGVHLGAVDDSLGLRLSAQLLLGEGGAEELLGSPAPPGLILTTDPHLVMDAEPSMRPARALRDQRVVNLPFP